MFVIERGILVSLLCVKKGGVLNKGFLSCCFMLIILKPSLVKCRVNAIIILYYCRIINNIIKIRIVIEVKQRGNYVEVCRRIAYNKGVDNIYMKTRIYDKIV